MERSDFDGQRGLVESFAYDKLQRLLTATVKTSGGQPLAVRTQAYDNQGNLTARSDVGSYSYERPVACSGHALPGPHAVSEAGGEALCYDAGGNVVKRGGTTIRYDVGGRARDLVHADNNRRVAFDYGPNGERVRRVEYPSALSGIAAKHVVHYVGGAQVRYQASGESGAGMVVDVKRMAGQVQVVQWGSGDAYRLSRRIVLTDAQGSVSSVLGAMTLQPVNEAGAASFDAFGQRRDTATWSTPKLWDGFLEQMLRASTTQGYTGHEMAESVGIIHMGGRIYDARLGRFLQADPFVQSPHDLQSWNRYSYALNNPLLYTDPSGYLSVGDALRVVAAVAITVYSGGTAAGAAWGYFGASVTAGQAFGAVIVGGFAAGAVQTGTLKGAVTGAVSAGVFYGIGTAFSQANASWAWEGDRLSWSGYAAKTLSHGAAGGVMAELQGGSFGHGFASAGFGEAVSPTVADIGSVPAQAIAVSVVGGTASVLAGGKFGNGAVTAAFGFAFNELSHEYLRRNTEVVETLYSTPDESFAAFTTRASDRLMSHTERTGFEYAIGLAGRADTNYAGDRQYAGIIETQGSHIYSAVTQIPKGFSPIMSTSGSILRIHSHGRYRDNFDKPIPANQRDMDYMRLGSGSRIAPTVPVQNRFKFSDQDAATRGGLATPSGLIWWPGDEP